MHFVPDATLHYDPDKYAYKSDWGDDQMHQAVGKGIALVRLAAFMFAVLSVGSCGGGGGGGGGSSGSKLFVADSGNDAIGSVVNTNPPPGNIIIDRVITGTSSNFISGTIPALLLDAARDQLYVSNETAIFVFHNAGTADGPVDFNRRVAMLVPPGGNFNSLNLDSTRDMLYVGDQPNGVRVYHNASTLNETGGPDNLPDRTIVPASFATTTSFVRDMAVDATRDILYVAVVTTAPSPSMSIFVFDDASTLDGSLPPDRTISITTSAFGTMGLFIDAANDRLYFADSGGGLGGGVSIFETASTRNDPVTPDKSVLLPSTILRLTVDTVNDRLYAAGSTALYIVPNISTVAPGPVPATAALASSGGSFTAVAVRP